MRVAKTDSLCSELARVLEVGKTCSIISSSQKGADSLAHRVSLKIGKPVEATLRAKSAYFPNGCSCYDLATKSPSE